VTSEEERVCEECFKLELKMVILLSHFLYVSCIGTVV